MPEQVTARNSAERNFIERIADQVMRELSVGAAVKIVQLEAKVEQMTRERDEALSRLTGAGVLPWIDVGEKKPEYGQRVLICIRRRYVKADDPKTERTSYNTMPAVYDAPQNRWRDYGNDHFLAGEVVYWQPFPTPPPNCIPESRVLQEGE